MTLHIQPNETPRDNFCMMPDIVNELMHKGKISNSAFLVYSIIRSLSGRYGQCYIGTRGLAERCRLGQKAVVKAKRELSTPFPELKGKSLINIIPGDARKGEADILNVEDIWQENRDYFRPPPLLPPAFTPPASDPPAAEPPASTWKQGCFQPEADLLLPKSGPASTWKRNKIATHISKIIISEPPEKQGVETPKADGAMPAALINNPSKISPSLESLKELTSKDKLWLTERYPESIISQAVVYTYHPTTKIEGEACHVRQIKAYCKNPDSYKQATQNLDKKSRGSIKDKIMAIPKGTKFYGYTLEHDDFGALLIHPNGVHNYGISWKDKDHGTKWQQFLIKIKVSQLDPRPALCGNVHNFPEEQYG